MRIIKEHLCQQFILRARGSLFKALDSRSQRCYHPPENVWHRLEQEELEERCPSGAYSSPLGPDTEKKKRSRQWTERFWALPQWLADKGGRPGFTMKPSVSPHGADIRRHECTVLTDEGLLEYEAVLNLEPQSQLPLGFCLESHLYSLSAVMQYGPCGIEACSIPASKPSQCFAFLIRRAITSLTDLRSI